MGTSPPCSAGFGGQPMFSLPQHHAFFAADQLTSQFSTSWWQSLLSSSWAAAAGARSSFGKAEAYCRRRPKSPGLPASMLPLGAMTWRVR